MLITVRGQRVKDATNDLRCKFSEAIFSLFGESVNGFTSFLWLTYASKHVVIQYITSIFKSQVILAI